MRSNFAVLWKFKTYLDKRWVGGSKMFMFMLRVKNVHVELCRWSKRSKCCPPSCWMPFVRDCFLIIYPHLPRVDLYLIFEKFELEKSSSRNLTFSLFELDFYCLCSRCVACKNRFQNWFLQAVCWTGSFQMDFSKMKYWSTGGYVEINLHLTMRGLFLKFEFVYIFRLIPSTSDLSDGDQPATPVPAPPPGYESRDPGFAPITDADTQLLPTQPTSSNQTSKKSYQDNNQCSTTTTTTNNDLESRL